MLQEPGVTRVADVRRFPRSGRHPHFNIETLPASLAEAGIDYRHRPALGGRRSTRRATPSRNTLWKVEAFRHYADYAETAPFQAALEQLEQLAADRPTAIMCAEAVWWRCHRRLITDYMLARGWAVTHLLGPGQQQAAAITPGAVVHDDGTIEYPATAGQGSLPM